jgi:hypothetical protein
MLRILQSPIRCLALGLCVAATPLATWAQACLYRGDSADTRVANRSGEITTPFPDTLSATDCRRLRVSTGAVTVYTLSKDRQAMAPRRVEPGGGSLVTGPAEDTANAPANMLQQIMVVLEGGQRLKTGSSRGAGEDYLQAALPTGFVARPPQDLVIVLGRQPDAALSSLEMTVDGKVVFQHQGPASELRLPAQPLSAGSLARWKLVYGAQSREGQFQVVPVEQLRALQAQLEGDTQGDDPTLRQLRIAAGLVQAGFAWDARDWLRPALLR